MYFYTTQHNNTCYEKTFLKQIIFRIDFSEPISNDKLLGDDVCEVTKPYFPHIGIDRVRFYNIASCDFDEKTGKIKNSVNRVKGIERTFFNSTKRNKVVFFNNSIVFTYNKYEGFERMYHSITEVFSRFLSINKFHVAKISLRYINLYNLSDDIKVTKSMFSNKLSKVMVPSLVDTYIDLKPVRSMLMTEYVYDDIKIKYRAGEYNDNYPSPIAKDNFAIDIDCFTSTGIDSIEDFCMFLNTSHSIILDLFEGSISDKMREVMINGK